MGPGPEAVLHSQQPTQQQVMGEPLSHAQAPVETWLCSWVACSVARGLDSPEPSLRPS